MTPSFVQYKIHVLIFLILLAAAGCSPTRVATVDVGSDFRPSNTPADSVLNRMPDYSDTLNTISGKGKAIVSEPGNTERVTVYFSGNRDKSLVTIKNSLGIEGGQILSEGDSLLIYNKVDKQAQKISVSDPGVSSVGHLASVNILRMMNYLPAEHRTRQLFESGKSYLLVLQDNTKVYIDKKSYNVLQVDQPKGAALPYSRIVYDAYGQINGFKLPRRVTIFSVDGSAKVALLIQSLDVNPADPDLEIDLPNDVKFVTQ